MMIILFKEIQSYFKVASKCSDGSIMAYCPAHDDKYASLHISPGKDNKILFHCFAGCTCKDITTAANIPFNVLADNNNFSQGDKENWQVYIENALGKEVISRYDYFSVINGKLEYCYSRIRLTSKIFTIGVFDHENNFSFGLSGKAEKDFQALYGSVDILLSDDNIDDFLFLPEGEKDVDTLREKGYNAITYGSSNTQWTNELSQLLKNRRIIILSDNDETGRKQANNIKSSLTNIAKEVYIINPVPEVEHGDISDYFDKHTKEDFEKLIEEKTSINSSIITYDEYSIIKKVVSKMDSIVTIDKNGNESRKPKKIVKNIEVILNEDDRLKGKLRLNIITNTIEVIGRLPWELCHNDIRPWTDTDASNLFSFIQSNYDFSNRKDVADAVTNVTYKNRYNPITDLLDALPYEGDGYVEKLLPYIGCELTEYNIAIVKLFLLGAVARVYNPGCKFDYMLILQGPQGIGKSTFLRKLALKDSYFNDSLCSLDNKDAYIQIMNTWIIEMAELKSFFRTSSGVEQIKAFISATKDNIRLPYARTTTETPRHVVFAGTTNSINFLLDDTGNRRFLILKTGTNTIEKDVFSQEFDADIKKALAESVNSYKNKNYSLVLDNKYANIALEYQNSAMIDNPIIGLISDYVKDTPLICIAEIWSAVYGHSPNEKCPKQISMEISQTLSNLGYKQLATPRHFEGFGCQRAFVKASDNSIEHASTPILADAEAEEEELFF